MPRHNDTEFRERSLAGVTRRLLFNRARHVTLEVICEATGVKSSFLTALIADKIDHPGADKVQAIYEFMTGKPLEIDCNK